MKVSELIDILEKIPQSTNVYIYTNGERKEVETVAEVPGESFYGQVVLIN